MIKLSIKIITLASITVGLGLNFVPKNGFTLPSHQIKSPKIQSNTIPVALPYDATIRLETGEEMSGKMTAFDQQQSMITLERSGKSKKMIETRLLIAFLRMPMI